MALSSDIETPILAALQILFDEQLLQKGLLKTLKQAPLQDDPTLTAPYLIFADDDTLGYGPDTREGYASAEIGSGSILHKLHYFKGMCGVPSQKSQMAARAAINDLRAKIERILAANYALGGITSDDYQIRIEGANQFLVQSNVGKIFGGGQEFYGKATITWYYPCSWYNIGA